VIPPGSNEMVCKSDSGTSHIILKEVTLTSRIRFDVKIATRVMSDDGTSR
jgi:hypothetical protein